MVKDIGEVEKKTLVEETEIKWKIADFSLCPENDVLQSSDFCFGNVSWHLEMYKNCSITEEFLRLYLYNDVVRDYSVEYSFGLEKHDGSIEQLIKGILKGSQNFQLRNEARFIKKSELHKRKSELVPCDILTVRGRLKFETVSSIQTSPVLDKSKLQNLIKLDTLSENFKSLFVNKDNCDTTLYVMDKEYKAHRAVLIARSSVFAAMFQHETTEKQTGIINIPDCTPEFFEEFLKFLYCGKLEEPSYRCALQLYEVSDKYDVQELKAFCKEFLMENLTVENLCEVAILSDKYEETNLLSAAQIFFNKKGSDIVETAEWDSLVKTNYRLSKKLLKEALSLKNSR